MPALHARLFHGGVIHAMARDEGGSRPGRALLIVGERIAAVGPEADVRSAAAESGLRIEEQDLAGRALLPGFVDPHAHPLTYGQLSSWVDVGPERAHSIKEMQDVLCGAHEALPTGRPLRAYGYEHLNVAE
jgi:predicted amidohydrolase YtcJ